MIADKVNKELRSVLETMRQECAQLDQHISAIETFLGQVGAPVKRGPGRPPKNASMLTAMPGAPVKRGPGRPPKNASVMTAMPGAPAKRGPGRPKGSKNKTASEKTSKTSNRRKPKWSAEARGVQA